MLSKLREPVNGLTHLGGAIAAFFGQIALLIAAWNGAAKIISSIVYGFSLIAMFSASAVYHLARESRPPFKHSESLIIPPFSCSLLGPIPRSA